MLRTKLYKSNNKKDLCFQITDWSSNDTYINNKDEEEDDEEEVNENKYKKKKRRLILRGYGITKEGYSVSIHIFNFKPYFYIKIPEDWDETKFNAETAMPPFGRHKILTESEIDKVVEFVWSL